MPRPSLVLLAAAALFAPDFNSVTVGKVIDLTAKGYNLTVALK
jgi:hypothetical protein